MRIEVQLARAAILLVAIGVDGDAVVGEIRAQEATHGVAVVLREGQSRAPLAQAAVGST